MRSIIGICILSLCWCVLFLSLGVFSGWVTVNVSAPWMTHPAAFLYRHLRLSVVPFCGLFLLYVYLVAKIRRCLQQKETRITRITYYDRLLNTSISTFFGVGVIWTAIGMETALMQVLNGVNDGQEAVANLSAWGLLENLVNGGLLLALSTTVFGGVCGYLLRLLKIVLLGENWDRFVLHEVGQHGNRDPA